MKLVLSVEELQFAVVEYLANRGQKVHANDVIIQTRAEGSFEDQTLSLDGASVAIAGLSVQEKNETRKS